MRVPELAANLAFWAGVPGYAFLLHDQGFGLFASLALGVLGAALTAVAVVWSVGSLVKER